MEKKITKKKLKQIEKREIKARFMEWGKLVKYRDNFGCVICGNIARLNAHHIIPRENILLRFDIMNGISLCPLHHQFCRKISAHNNPFAFNVWLEENRPEQFKYLKSYVKGGNR